MDKTSFTERLALLRKTAEQLRTAAEIVLAEVQHMEAAQRRFAARAGAEATRAHCCGGGRIVITPAKSSTSPSLPRRPAGS